MSKISIIGFFAVHLYQCMNKQCYKLFEMGLRAAASIIAIVLFFISCHGGNPQATPTAGDTLKLNHAEYLTMIEHEEYTEVQILNPWNKGKLLQTIKLTKSPTPSRALLFTTTHSNLIEELGGIDLIAGICETEYIANPRLLQAIDEGRIIPMGSAMTPDRERIVNLNPDIILLSPYENAATYGNLESLGIPIVQCADYMETSALGRAEWIRFYGRLLGKGREADSLFAAIEVQYNNLKALTDSVDNAKRPSVLFDTRNGSAWYVPGGQSTIAQLVSDAGGHYIFSDNPKSGSIPLAFESVLSRGENADTWLIRYNNSQTRLTHSDLGNIYQPYTLFRAYKQGNVYGCNSAELIFYEETPFHPERLLRDFIRILHPELLPNETLRYFHKL